MENQESSTVSPSAAGFTLVESGVPTPAQRVIVWEGLAVDVRCVTRVEIISPAEMATEYERTGRGLQPCDTDVVVLRYETDDTAGALYAEVMNPELKSRLAEWFTLEIKHGTAARLDMHTIQGELEHAFQLSVGARG